MSLNLTALEIEPGLVQDETEFDVRQGGYVSINNMRPHEGRMEVIGGWEFFSTTQLTGKCRGAHAWRDTRGRLNFAFGTHSKLYVLRGGVVYDITPAGFVAGNENGTGTGGYGTGGYGTGGYGASGVASGSTTVAEDTFPMTWALDNYGEWLIANPRGRPIYVWKNDTSAAAVQLAADVSVHDADFTSYANQAAFDVDYTRGTGWTFDATDDEADCDGSQTGVSNLTRSVTTVALERYRVTVTFERTAGTIAALAASVAGLASSEASGTVVTTFIASGSSTVIGAQGDADFVGSVTDIKVEQMRAPTRVMYARVTDEELIMAYGCNEEVSDTWNPRCIRHSDLQDIEEWTTKPSNSAREKILRNNGRLIAGCDFAGDGLVWTDAEVLSERYVGSVNEVYSWTTLGQSCGLIGPNAFAVLGQRAFWVAPDTKFRFVTLGGEPSVIPSPIDQTFENALLVSQVEKLSAGTVSQYGEVWWFYAHKDDGGECSRYVAFSAATQKWFEGTMARTVWLDSRAYQYPIAVDASGYVYIHERGTSANGDALEASAITGDIHLQESGKLMMLRSVRPDIHNQVGTVNLTIRSKAYPQGDVIEYGPFAMAPGADRVDFRAQGAIVQLKFAMSSVQARARLGRPVFDITQRGRR